MGRVVDNLTAWLETSTNSGRHQTLFAIAARLAEEGYSEEAAYELLRGACDAASTRDIADREVEDAVRDGFAKAAGESVDTAPKWDPMCPEALRRIIRSIEEPLQLADTGLSSADVIPRLYKPGDILYVGSGVDGGHRVQADQWGAREIRAKFITPNPYSRWDGHTKQGKLTTGNCKDGVYCRRYLIVEFDLAPDGLPFSQTAQAKILTHLATTAPLVMAVDSGNKSIHGWFGCPPDPIDWFRRAVTLGADPALWRIQQLTRLPGGLRQNGTRQSILYWGLPDESGSD